MCDGCGPGGVPDCSPVRDHQPSAGIEHQLQDVLLLAQQLNHRDCLHRQFQPVESQSTRWNQQLHDQSRRDCRNDPSMQLSEQSVHIQAHVGLDSNDSVDLDEQCDQPDVPAPANSGRARILQLVLAV